jgi:hypothetical protein
MNQLINKKKTQKRKSMIKFPLVLAMIVFTGCSTVNGINSPDNISTYPTATTTPPGIPSDSGRATPTPVPTGVSFNIFIDKQALSGNRSLYIAIYNQEQININKIKNDPVEMEKRLNDANSKGASPAPLNDDFESFSFDGSEVKDIMVIKSEKLKPGENYEIVISSYGSDNCVTSEADITGIVTSNIINLKVSNWREVQVGCGLGFPN